jgi:hypothetical protein
MSVSAIALFGSRARGDHESGSDTDLLLITSEPTPRHLSRGKPCLICSPIADLGSPTNTVVTNISKAFYAARCWTDRSMNASPESARTRSIAPKAIS